MQQTLSHKKQREADSNSKSEETQNKCDLFLPSSPSNPTRIRGCGGGGGKRQTHLLQSRDSCAEGAPLYKSVYVYVITTENNCVHTSATLYIYTRPWDLRVEWKKAAAITERGVRVLFFRDSPTLSHHPECVKVAASAVVVYLAKKSPLFFNPRQKKIPRLLASSGVDLAFIWDVSPTGNARWIESGGKTFLRSSSSVSV